MLSDSEFQAEDVLQELPSFGSNFFIPALSDKPQDPILDTLKWEQASNNRVAQLNDLPPELTLLLEPPSPPRRTDSLWIDAIQKHNILGRSRILSWDALRSSRPQPASPGALLSEQDSMMFAAARHYVQPRIQQPGVFVEYITLDHLLRSMKLIVLGTSSFLHKWDPISERFVDSVSTKECQRVLLVDGKDEVISSSIMSRFLSIGTSLRRLEKVVDDTRSLKAHNNATMHAFAHALSTCLISLRHSLAACPPSENQLSAANWTLSTILMQHSQYESILSALAKLCKREESMSPKDYVSVPSPPKDLLSLIYNELSTYIERQSSSIVIAMLAFILTTTSRDYFEQVSISVGFGAHRHPRSTEENLDEDKNQNNEEFPAFFPPELVQALPIARKSLVLLQAAQPDHSFAKISANSDHCRVKWFWTTDEVFSALRGDPSFENCVGHLKDATLDPTVPGIASSRYKPELAGFHIFDLEPGSQIGQSCFDAVYTGGAEAELQRFIRTFPEELPSVTPTLAHLSSLVFQPLLHHCRALSGTLLSLYLSLPPPQDVYSHVQLMGSYILLLSPSFKRRLSVALFSDSDTFVSEFAQHSPGQWFTLRELRRNPVQGSNNSNKPWPVGLAPALLDKETWPPVDTDLSFFLRTVIVDSFVEMGPVEETSKDLDEVENRLGFAIRDMPDEKEQSRWMSPLSVEALDFLYMDYRPPHPLEVVITPDILSKYQRMFTLLLRILRVEHALHAVFRMAISSDKPIFQTLASSRKLFLQFRFAAQSFITNFSEYVYDTAIGGNFDPFLASLRTVADKNETHFRFSDIFSLAGVHSKVLNDMLTACLQRASQRVGATLLRDAMQIVLDFSVLAGELYRGRVEEYQAAPLLDNMYRQFRKKVANLIKLLQGAIDKNVSLRALVEVPRAAGLYDEHRPVGGTEALPHLLTSYRCLSASRTRVLSPKHCSISLSCTPRNLSTSLPRFYSDKTPAQTKVADPEYSTKPARNLPKKLGPSPDFQQVYEEFLQDPSNLPPHRLWRHIFNVATNERVAIANPETADLVAKQFIPRGRKAATVIEAFPGPGQLTRALMKLPKTRVERIIVLEDNKTYLPFLKVDPLEQLDSRVKVIPLSGIEWSSFDSIQEMGLLDHVEEVPWDGGVHPKLQFVSHLPINVHGEQLVSQYLRLMPDRHWLFKYGRVKLNFLLSDYVWQRITAPAGDKIMRCKLSVVSECTSELNSLLFDELQPYPNHFHPILFRKYTLEADVRKGNNRKAGNPFRALIKPGTLDIWDYCVRRLFVQKATAVGRAIPGLGPGAQSLLPELESQVDLKKTVRSLNVQDWNHIVQAFMNWPFAPTDLGISDSMLDRYEGRNSPSR
ncbi:hypothetical protein D9758_006819 [Tetrapyrgos nigripes]|uniref:Mitochondrial transcription factor 1 n=1 Tax=Tetrapyrgos nigripes TaxID=182062 RepID=A0A8H5CVI7_9AGAR|nr:hypothetical protein D9758_006819 [Tetrapyrgos nigripes]